MSGAKPGHCVGPVVPVSWSGQMPPAHSDHAYKEVVMKITLTEAAAMDQDEFRNKVLDGELLFDEKFIRRRPRIAWFGWQPYIAWDVEASDGKTTIRFIG